MARYKDCDKCYHRHVCAGDTDKWNYYGECPHYIKFADVAAKTEVARGIFEEIEDILKIVKIPSVNADGCVTPLQVGYWAIDPNDYATLKKKYTEGAE